MGRKNEADNLNSEKCRDHFSSGRRADQHDGVFLRGHQQQQQNAARRQRIIDPAAGRAARPEQEE